VTGLRLLVAILLAAGFVFGALTYRAYQDGHSSVETNAWSTFTCLSLGVFFWVLLPYVQRLMDALQ